MRRKTARCPARSARCSAHGLAHSARFQQTAKRRISCHGQNGSPGSLQPCIAKRFCRLKAVRLTALPRRQKPPLLYAPPSVLSRMPEKQTSFPAFFCVPQKIPADAAQWFSFSLTKCRKTFIMIYYYITKLRRLFPDHPEKGTNPPACRGEIIPCPKKRSGCRIRRTACVMRRERMS